MSNIERQEMAQPPQPPQQPDGVPLDETVPGKTSSTEYMRADWRPGHLMRTLHGRVIDFEPPKEVSVLIFDPKIFEFIVRLCTLV